MQKMVNKLTKATKSTTNLKKTKKKDVGIEIKTPEDVYKAVSEITLNRKTEIEEDSELSNAICGLAHVAGENFMMLVKETIKTGDEKDMLLVLQLMYLKLSAEMIGKGNVELSSQIPISGYGKVRPLDTSVNTVPLYI
jgi:hypothetical protein